MNNIFRNSSSSVGSIRVNLDVIKQAIQLRQQKKMSLGDSVIAATALLEKLTLVTANTKDFQYIHNLELTDSITL